MATIFENKIDRITLLQKEKLKYIFFFAQREMKIILYYDLCGWIEKYKLLGYPLALWP